MRGAFLLGLVGCMMFGMTACTSMLPTDIQIYANHFPLSPTDVREIQRLALLADIKKPVAHIQTQGGDEVSVICGGLNLRSTDLVYFTARRRQGRWFIDKSSIATRRENEDDRVIVE